MRSTLRLVLGLAAVSAFPLATKAALPAPAAEVLDRMMAFVDPLWDERAGFIWTPNAATPDGRRVHRIRETGWYALGLLQRDAPGDRERAVQAFAAMLGHQITDPGEPWDGTFYRFPEEMQLTLFPEMWRDYDPNWRQFIGTTFALAMIKFEDRLPAPLRARLRKSIEHAVDGERGHGRLRPTYTNIALMQAFLLGYAGNALDRPELVREGDQLAEAVHAAFREHDAFEEYNSPTYYGVDFYGLSLWRAHGVTPRVRELGAALEAVLWRDTAAFYHGGLRNLCGPYDRAYGMDMTRYASLTGLWLRIEMGNTAPFPELDRPMGHAHDFVYAAPFIVLGTEIPEDARAAFRTFSGERMVERQLPRGRVATAWLGENVMLGGEHTGKSRGAGGEHNQLHPATIHWRTPGGEIGWVLLTQAPRTDARAAPRQLTISAIGDATFRISAPGLTADPVARNRWRLPGLTLAVATDATGFKIEAGDGWLDVTYREATRFELRVE